MSVLALTVFIIMPLPPTIFDDNTQSGEILIKSEDFSEKTWAEWVNFGIIPLRELNGGDLLAWGVLEGGDSPARLTEYRGEVSEGEGFLVVLEPFLPQYAVMGVFERLESLDLEPHWLYHAKSESPLPAVISIQPESEFENWWPIIEQMHGIYWVEPVLQTEGRNDVAAAMMQTGEVESQPAWLLGLDGSGVVVAFADSGIDRDHACFREATEAGASGSEWNNATGTPGVNHRKIVLVNETIDDWDSPSDENYRHGTHIAGSLACRSVWEVDAENRGDWVNATPSEGTSISHGAKLVVEDVVDGDGWHIPEIESLFSEAARNGAVIRSDSWGDDTTEYTYRTSMFDTWLYQVPWSVSFVAPGNTGGEVLEPANGLNVVSVGAAENDGSDDIWTLSPRDETEQGRMGVTVVAPGIKIISAKADGLHDSYNDEMRSSTGTSMSTPQAAAAAAVIQQMVEDGWISDNRSGEAVSVASLRPDWAEFVDENLSDGAIVLTDGFTPSGPLLRALMTLSGDSLEGGRQAESLLGQAPDSQQGWGRINLSNLVNFSQLEDELSNENTTAVEASSNLWIHDSFRLKENEWQNLVSSWMAENAEGSVAEHLWKGEGAIGPFLSTGEEVVWRMDVEEGSDVDIRLAWNSAPNIENRDDLDLVVILDDGTTILGNDFSQSGNAERIETIEGIHIPSSELSGVSSLKVKVVAHHVNSGPNSGVVGLMGDKIGFAVAVNGVLRAGVFATQGWEEITPTTSSDGVQWGDSIERYSPAIMLMIVLFIVGIVIIDWRKRGENEWGGLNMTKGQPSNHEGFSLPTAIVSQIGDDDE